MPIKSYEEDDMNGISNVKGMGGMFFPNNCQPAPVYIKTIWPAEAKVMLEHNSPQQRHVKPRAIERFVQDMDNGDFDAMCGDLVRVDTDGNVIDGQNRLHAIVRANRPQQVLYAEGFSPNDFTKVDGGTARTAADTLRGQKYANVVAPLTRYVMNYEKSGELNEAVFKRPQSKTAISERALGDESLAWCAEHGYKIASVMGGGAMSAIAFALWLALGVDPAATEKMAEMLLQQPPTQTGWAMCQWTGSMRLKGKAGSWPVFRAYAVVWNAFSEGRDLKIVKTYTEQKARFNGITHPFCRAC